MRIVEEFIPVMTLAEFADMHGLTMKVSERRVPEGARNRYYARFENTDIGCGGVLVGAFGNGATPEDAMAAYAEEIALKRLVVDAYRPTRREVAVPRLKP